MTPTEVPGRARRAIAHRVDAALFLAVPRLWRRRWQPDSWVLLASDPLAVPQGFLVPERAADIRARFPRESEALLARADALLDNRFRFFGYPEAVVADRGPDVDPFSGRSWPKRHGKRIDYRRAGSADPKWIWELNRCQDLPLLVAAWLLSGESRYAEIAAARLESWIETHPPGRGIAWSSGFEAGVRAISLAVAFDGLRGSAFLPRERAGLIVQALGQHVTWIDRDPSTGSSANNHRIGELVGVVAVSALVPELRDSDRRLESALVALGREVERQIRADGTTAEQAFSYHVFVLDLLLVALALLDARDRRAPNSLCAALHRSADALWAQLDDDEPEPRYGDSDNGRALVLDASDVRSARGVAAAIAARFGHSGAARVARDTDSTSHWLFGAEGAERFEKTARASAPETLTLSEGGLTILRGSGCRTLFDHGPHGYLSLAAHAHADALAIDVALHDTPIVSDPGVGSYFAKPEVREAFRGTGFHATVTVDGVNSSEAGGPFLWIKHAAGRLLFFDPEGAAIAEHEGYSRLSDPVVHRRAVVLVGGGALLVLDQLHAHGSHRYSQRWPFHPALDVAERGPAHVSLRGERAGALLIFATLDDFQLRLAREQERPPLGWWSDGLESVVPAWLVAMELEATGTVELATLVVPFVGETPGVDGFGLGLERRSGVTLITIQPGAEEIEFDLASSRPAVRRVAAAGAL